MSDAVSWEYVVGVHAITSGAGEPPTRRLSVRSGWLYQVAVLGYNVTIDKWVVTGWHPPVFVPYDAPVAHH